MSPPPPLRPAHKGIGTVLIAYAIVGPIIWTTIENERTRSSGRMTPPFGSGQSDLQHVIFSLFLFDTFVALPAFVLRAQSSNLQRAACGLLPLFWLLAVNGLYDSYNEHNNAAGQEALNITSMNTSCEAGSRQMGSQAYSLISLQKLCRRPKEGCTLPPKCSDGTGCEGLEPIDFDDMGGPSGPESVGCEDWEDGEECLCQDAAGGLVSCDPNGLGVTYVGTGCEWVMFRCAYRMFAREERVNRTCATSEQQCRSNGCNSLTLVNADLASVPGWIGNFTDFGTGTWNWFRDPVDPAVPVLSLGFVSL